MSSLRCSADEPIAIIGSACRFPGGSSSTSKLWELLREPRDVVRPFDPKRFNLGRFYNPDGKTHGATDVKAKSYLLDEDSRLFDAGFFAISPVEAAGMDPQQRLLLEATYEASESAGVPLEKLRGSLTSVHVGVMSNDYSVIQARDTETLPKYNATGTANSILSNRVSYVFDLKGPSVTLDTACSSSLVALHHAVQGLRTGDSEMAVVGGTNLIFEPTPYIAESKLHMLSPDSQSRMWDKSANGYARGEGIAALLLKPLSAAQRDGDPIQGVIRATGVNSDGTSPGITMPFAPTQAALIRHVYQQAGLDPMQDPPQYFECHGTGTQAGDPVEARAVFEAFYRDGKTGVAKADPQTIHVGSVKTVIGHLEGCAGLAGVIKVLLALKHQTIPPNMHFNNLNPKIAQYYGSGALVIPTTPLPWPELPAGAPMRASINSFGFGGTNAHAIIESLATLEAKPNVGKESPVLGAGVVGPLLFSASSGSALLRSVQAYLAHLQQNEDIDLRDLSWLLQTRRSTHRVRACFTGASRQQVLDSMADFVSRHQKAATKGGDIGSVARLVNPKEAPGTLGVFTGQGAQWATMGRDLYQSSPLFRWSLDACGAVLRDGLLPGDAPVWSLVEEITKSPAESRLSEAALSQPLCTALQVALVDMLNAAGVKLDATVGHSSGEIAATYAAGIITRQAAMQIAYYRGYYAHLCQGADGQKGGMMAVGLSMDAATRFCRQPAYNGRIVVAASNSPQSCTLSGDLDAILEAKQQLDLENTFARQLQVDTAYHSHHMRACADDYLRALLACDIQITQPKPGCIWNSSVRGDTRLLKPGVGLDSLKGPYWVANMVQTVKFSQAIESSIWHGGPWDMAIEIGPHPALKGPTEQTLKAAYGAVPKYVGLLKRKSGDVEAFQEAIGHIWSQLGPSHVDFTGYRNSFYESDSAPAPPRMISDLPGYSWDHDKVYWRESRTSMRYRTGRDAGHELLGRRVPDDNDRELRWRNLLRLSEMPWLRGHEVLGEVLLPGAAYVSIAAQAAQSLADIAAPGRRIKQLSVEDIDILRPVVVPDNKDGVETLFTAQVLPTDKAQGVVRAQFSYYVCQNETTGVMIHTCSGTLVIQLSQISDDAAEAYVLPGRQAVPENVVHIESEPIYDMFHGIGLNYTGAFDAITESRRRLGYTAATGVWPVDSPIAATQSQYILHPAILDVAFQSLFVAHVHPSSKLLKSALLPSHIDRVIIDPRVPVRPATGAGTTCSFDAWVISATGAALDGDINIYDAESGRAFAQVEGLSTRSAGGGQSASQDKNVFLKTVHGNDACLGGLVLPSRDPILDARALQANVAVERLALFYMRRVIDEIKSEERDGLERSPRQMLDAFEEHVDTVREGQSPFLSSDWLADDENSVQIAGFEHPDPEAVELKLLHAVGTELTQIIRGQKQFMEVSHEGQSQNLKQYSPSASVVTDHAIGQLLKQITFKFPRCKMLEIGGAAGKTSTTKSILGAVENMYDSYTYTGASSDVLSNVAAELPDAERIIYNTLDIENELDSQGFSLNSYDVVIAPHILSVQSATGTALEESLQKVRSLLRPGGYLVLSEITGAESKVGGFLFGGQEPVETGEWHRLLRRSGFSGADTVFYDNADESTHVHSCIVSRAVNDDFLRLVQPLSFAPEPTRPLLMIGGRRLYSSKVMDEIEKLLPPAWWQSGLVRVVPSIDKLKLDGTEGDLVDVVCLQDVDESLFAQLPMSQSRLGKLQQLLMSARNLLWVTGAGAAYTPRASMIRGIARVVPIEMPHLTMQILGLELEAGGAGPTFDARHCVEALLRLRHMDELKAKAESDSILWSIEPESEVLAGGSVSIPRVMPDTDLDERYNAKTRSIVKTVDATDMAVQTIMPNGSSRLALQAAEKVLENLSEGTQVQVEHTIHIPSYSRNDQGLYLLCGHLVQKKDHSVMAVTDVNASRPFVECEKLAMVDSSLCTPIALEATVDSLLCHALVNRVKKAGPVVTVLLLEPELHIAKQVEAQLTTSGHRVYCISSRTDFPKNWIRLHANASKRMARQCLPSSKVDIFFDCSPESMSETHGAKQLRACLPSTCEKWRLDAELLEDALDSTDISLTALFAAASIDIKDIQQSEEPRCTTIVAADLAGKDMATLAHQRYITDWHQRKALPLTIQPLDVNPLGSLRSDRTYLLVGGSGGLGLSLCHLMIRHGARHIAITSRNPKVDAGLQEEADRVGASVQMVAMDATKRDQVVAAVTKVRDTMPPIAGVCNLSMVLHDKMFLDMSARQLNGTLEAKVIGTEILDDIFSSTDVNDEHPPLDFFILTSSTASTVGNVGQANYHAANLFMAAVVERRRARRLAASVIQIGWVADTGYVTSSDRYHMLEDHFRSMRFIPLSETDVQDAFAQAVRAGKPEADAGSHDITMGLEPPTVPMQPNQKSKALWVSNPQLMSLMPYSTLSTSSQQQLAARGASGSSVREQVDAAESEEAAVEVVAAAFANKLETMLQLPAGSVQADLERPVINLGIDSLVATEIRTWFLKDLDAEVAVVKILGGDTVLELCVQATKKMWANRTIKDVKEVKETKAPAAVTPTPVPKPAPTPIPTSAASPEVVAPVASVSASITTNSVSNSSYLLASKLNSLGDKTGSSTPMTAFTPRSGALTPMSGAATPLTESSSTGNVDSNSSETSSCDENQTDVKDTIAKKESTCPPVLLREAPMSAAQSRIWFVSKHYDDPAAYNTAFHYRLQGHVSTARLRRALQLVVNHHECLRTCFYPRLEDGHPMQGVMAKSAFELTVKQADDDEAVFDHDAILRDTLSEFKSRTWDLEQGKTMAIAVLARSATEHDLVLGYHHILMDGWSLALFLRDVDRAYRLQPLDTLAQVSYVDYSIHQLAEEKTGILDEDLEFWRSEFEILPDTLPLLPTARGLDRSTLAQKHQDSGSHYIDHELNLAQLEAQKDLCKRLRVSPFHLHLALFQVFLARLANIEDVCVGVVDANRRDERFGGTVGCFVNMLPLRSSIASKATFPDVASAASRKAMEVFARGTVPFDRILDQSRAPRAVGSNPLFQAAINYRTAVGGMDMWNLPLGDECRMQLSTKEAKEAENPYDVSLGFIETQAGCLVQMWCLADLYGQDACRTMLDTYLGLLEVVARNPYVSVANVSLHDAASVSRALEVGKGPEMDFGWPATLSERVQDICLSNATKTAITTSSGSTLSYAQLAARINHAAQKILTEGGTPGDRIALLCEPSVDSVVAMLAILHIGAVYVPLDTSLPASRHADMVSGCVPKILLCHAQTEQRVKTLTQSFSEVKAVLVDCEDSIDDSNEQILLPFVAKSDSPAILLFTSGSTGTPKGIILTQSNFVNHIALKTHEMGLVQECVLQQSSLGFDMSLIQIFSALANGGHLVIAESDIRRDPIELVKLIARENVSMTIATPTEYLAWTNSAADVLQKSTAWRFAFSGGEQVTRQLKTELSRLSLPNLTLTNCYGPTEITAAATFQCISLKAEADSCIVSGDAGAWAQYAVGKALPNYSICIVDAAGHPQPCGHIGEICIGGAGVAVGYLDQPDQTKSKFITDLMSQSKGHIMYRTGDKGRLLSDGTLLCLGRLDGDTQIKLRGQRIELQEVEAALLRASEDALEAVVVSLRDSVLVAHATLCTTSRGDSLAGETNVAQILARVKLPQAFIPATIRILTTMPTTSNGKLDRKAIARLPLGAEDTNGKTEKKMEKMTVREGELRLLWERVLPALGDTRLGPSSDFFLYGGNSLLLMKLQKAIKETTGVHVTTKQLYEATTLRAMTRCVFRQGTEGQQDASAIDWAAETSVPDWLQDRIKQLATGQSPGAVTGDAKGIEVLLTGATSFLGGHLLSSLLQSPVVTKVHCIAVPLDEQAKLPQGNSKVVGYSGSLLSPTLGLTQEERTRLEETVHVMIHAGSNGHCLNRFDSLRTPNLQSLHFLTSLALPRSIPLMFLSSSRAVLLSGNPAPKPGSLKATPPAVNGKDGYTASKWAGEVFLENLVAYLNDTGKSSLKVAVHRPCTLVSEQAPNSDAMNGVLRYSLAMRCAPRLKRAEGYLDFGPLDTIVGEITTAALELAAPTPFQQAEIHFRHHSGGIKSPMGEFRAHLERVYGGSFEELDMEDWVIRAGQQGMDPLIVAYIEALLESGMPMISPYMGEE